MGKVEALRVSAPQKIIDKIITVLENFVILVNISLCNDFVRAKIVLK